LVLTFLAPNSLSCADGAVKNLLTHPSLYVVAYEPYLNALLES